jgi:hypothetical protein
MQKLYIAVFFLFTSCSKHFNYIGSINKKKPTQVDIYVSAKAIKKPYEIMGKGFMERSPFTRKFQEKLQLKAIQKAKAVGADAILFEDYFFVVPGNNVSSVFRTDSTANGLLTVGHTNVSPASINGFNILFLKYTDH